MVTCDWKKTGSLQPNNLHEANMQTSRSLSPQIRRLGCEIAAQSPESGILGCNCLANILM
jgi:hypothetical protein